MAAAFRPVNSPLPAEAKADDKMTTSPTTPRPSTAPHPQTPQTIPEEVKTPTKATFGSGSGGLASQKPLPSSPFPQAVQVPESAEKVKTPTRANSQHSRKSRDSEDVDMDESDGEAGEDGAGSDDDSVNADGTRSSKKKKSQRFYCTDYPPCNLSFTRSEHLARHIRKHTGERPFQCHCSRRFSRLDNLRQHAQTVHVNEDIPIDSLAATGARFQRQMRTERVRQQGGGRARSSTAGSASGPVRGHSKSLSTSSIASVGSIGPAFGGVRDDLRRRPPPLVMATDPRARLSLESHRSDGPYGYRPVSPTEYGTPTSATFSTTGQSSPRWSGIASPTTSHSRSQSMYSSGSRTPGRRLSVPSGANPFQSPHGGPVNRVMYGGPVNASNNGAYSPAASSHLASPTTPTSGWSGRRDSTSSNADEAWRRRTWHPDTRNFNTNTSHLSNVLTPGQIQPNPAPPIANVTNQQQTLRLPGIESFDPLPSRQISPPRRIPSPMMVDEAAHPPALLPGSDAAADGRRNVAQWDMGLHRGLTRLDITNTTPPRDSAGAWANEVNQAVQAQAEQVRLNPPTVRFEVEPPSYSNSSAFTRNHHHTMSMPSIASRETKRHGWYHGPTNSHVHGPRPEAPIHEPRGPHVNRMIHPNMNHFTGFPARQAEPQPPQQQQPGADRTGNPDPLRRLEALVAVATSEGTTAAAY